MSESIDGKIDVIVTADGYAIGIGWLCEDGYNVELLLDFDLREPQMPLPMVFRDRARAMQYVCERGGDIVELSPEGLYDYYKTRN